jgi:cation transport protein ChaC
MTILTRENLGNGSYRTGLAMPEHLAWSEAQVEESLAATWALRPEGPVWVFAYGSLMWNPLIAIEEERTATLQGWHRSFCLRSIAGRGRPERPGRVLSLQPGGEVQGVALRLAESTALDELRLLWTREMPSGAYLPRWNTVVLADGSAIQAVSFTADADHPLHDDDESAETVAQAVAFAAGAFGPNVDYVRSLEKALHDRGLSDPYVAAIVGALEKAMGTRAADAHRGASEP